MSFCHCQWLHSSCNFLYSSGHAKLHANAISCDQFVIRPRFMIWRCRGQCALGLLSTMRFSCFLFVFRDELKFTGSQSYNCQCRRSHDSKCRAPGLKHHALSSFDRTTFSEAELIQLGLRNMRAWPLEFPYCQEAIIRMR